MHGGAVRSTSPHPAAIVIAGMVGLHQAVFDLRAASTIRRLVVLPSYIEFH
jgi:hypothetical protein